MAALIENQQRRRLHRERGSYRYAERMATVVHDDICPRCGAVLTITDSDTGQIVECGKCGSRSVEVRAPSASAIAQAPSPTLEITESFWERHPRWFAVQFACYFLSLAVGVVGLVTTTVVAMVGFAVSALLGGLGFRLPPWRERITERKIIR
jgi:ribosomal protein S27AE